MAFAVAAIVGGTLALAGAGTKLGMSLAGRAKRIEEQEAAQAEMDQLKEQYENLDTSNIYADVRNPYAENVAANLENVYEDLTVNQQQAQMEQQMAQQQQANIMQQMGAAAGGSGIAALAQTMAQQGQLQAQRASASIGMQESQIQQLQAGEASRLQRMEVSGAQLSQQGAAMQQQMRLKGAEEARALEYSKTGTMLGMAQQRTAAANQARQEAMQQQMSAVGDIAAAGGQIAGGVSALGGGGTTPQTFDLSQATGLGGGSQPKLSSAGTQESLLSDMSPKLQRQTGVATDFSNEGNMTWGGYDPYDFGIPNPNEGIPGSIEIGTSLNPNYLSPFPKKKRKKK